MLTKREIPISALLHVIDRRFKQIVIEGLPEIDNASVVQGQILRYLSLEKEVMPNDLCEHFHLTRATISGVLKRMESKGYIKLVDNLNDKRSKIIRLLKKGELLNQNVLERFKSTEDILLKNLTNEEIESLRTILLKMNANVERGDEVD